MRYVPTFCEIFLRIFLFSIYLTCQELSAFRRVVQEEELWLYRYPHMESYVPMGTLWCCAVVLPVMAVLTHYLYTRDRLDLTEALYCFSLIVTLNGAITNTLKVMVGRPRPDYLARCYGAGIRGGGGGGECTGPAELVNDGRKSFPSGHSSVAFSCFGFLSLYLAGKLHLMSRTCTYTGFRLILVLTPLLLSVGVAVSRTCDYHHHWQDVVVGSMLGMLVSSLCYFQYYPTLWTDQCNAPRRHPSLLRVKEI